jgi:hypothetical protein
MNGEARDLERFLINKLDQRADTGARVITETVHTGSSLIEKLDYTPDEIRLLLRSIEQNGAPKRQRVRPTP